MSSLVLDLFAGPGGWDEGAKPLGLAPVGIEWDAAACRTGKAAGHHRVRADVSQLPTAPMVGKVAGLIASPPCQTFSMAGKGAGRDALPELQDAVERVWRGATPAETCPTDLDVKSVLVLEPVRYARDLRPEWIALEQVPAVLPIWQALAVILRHGGYSLWTGVLNAADYGVPQTRQRAILIASRVQKVAPPPPTHTKGRSPMKRTRRNTGPDQATRDAIFQRDQSCCAICSRSDCGTRLVPHHRMPRGRGGDNRLSNLVLLGDMGGCHDLIVESRRTRSDLSGWLVRTGEDPADKPLIWHGTWVRLGDDGSVTPCDAPELAGGSCPIPDFDDCTGQGPCLACPRGEVA